MYTKNSSGRLYIASWPPRDEHEGYGRIHPLVRGDLCVVRREVRPGMSHVVYGPASMRKCLAWRSAKEAQAHGDVRTRRRPQSARSYVG